MNRRDFLITAGVLAVAPAAVKQKRDCGFVAPPVRVYIDNHGPCKDCCPWWPHQCQMTKHELLACEKRRTVTHAPPCWDYVASPQTELGRRLTEIRRRIKASGQPLLDWDDIDRELA